MIMEAFDWALDDLTLDALKIARLLAVSGKSDLQFLTDTRGL